MDQRARDAYKLRWRHQISKTPERALTLISHMHGRMISGERDAWITGPAHRRARRTNYRTGANASPRAFVQIAV